MTITRKERTTLIRNSVVEYFFNNIYNHDRYFRGITFTNCNYNFNYNINIIENNSNRIIKKLRNNNEYKLQIFKNYNRIIEEIELRNNNRDKLQIFKNYNYQNNRNDKYIFKKRNKINFKKSYKY